MKDYLKTFDQDTEKKLHIDISPGCTKRRVEMTHKPTGVYYMEVSSILSDLELLKCVEYKLKEKLMMHYEQQERLKPKMTLKFPNSDKLRCDCEGSGSHDLLLGKTKEPKEPIHPGWVAYDLLIASGHDCSYGLDFIKASECLGLTVELLNMIVCGDTSIHPMIAYKLAKVISGTDVRFWMDLQEKYDACNEGQSI